MKNKLLKRLGIIVLSVAITFGSASVNQLCVYAEEIENQESSGDTDELGNKVPTIEELNEIPANMPNNRNGSDEAAYVDADQVMDVNYGYIDFNDGLVKQNGGTNAAEYDLNSTKNCVMVDNNHYVVSNNGRINNNNNFVAQNLAQGVIDNNIGKVAENKGTINVNDAKGIVSSNTNLVICNDGVVVNSGKVIANFGNVETDSESVSVSSTVVHNFSTGTCDANTTVENHWWEVVFDNMNVLNTQWRTSEIYDLFHETGILNSNANDIADISLVSRTNYEKKETKYYAKQSGELVIAPINGYEINKPVFYKLGTNEEIILTESNLLYNDVSGEWVVKNLSENVTIRFEFKGNSQSSNPSPAIRPSESANSVQSVNPTQIDVVVITEQPVQTAQPEQLEQPVQSVHPVQAIQQVLTVQPVVMTQVQIAENVTGSEAYVAKQAEIETTLTKILNTVETMTPQQVENLKTTGLSIDAGGCSVAGANVSQLILKALDKGIPMNIAFVTDGKLLNLTIPTGLNISQFINIDGTIDLVKLFNAIQKKEINKFR